MRIIGSVLKTERRSGSFNDRETGEARPYDFWTVRVLTDDADVFEVRIPGNRADITVPAKGDDVDFPVTAAVRQGRVQLTASASSRELAHV